VVVVVVTLLRRGPRRRKGRRGCRWRRSRSDWGAGWGRNDTGGRSGRVVWFIRRDARLCLQRTGGFWACGSFRWEFSLSLGVLLFRDFYSFFFENSSRLY
jgi:hypothetical protein